ncbi:disulfide bond formation protein B [Marinicella sp. W31]|uniref:disulfide bond formation protein B n=1 Tax=Marinicella sp. W31 TaxID=3023713 RepID=UPI00375715A7
MKVLGPNQFRLLTLMPVLFCAGLLGYAYYVEYVEYLYPCPLCILQRVVFAAIALLFLLALIKPVRGIGKTVFGVLNIIVGLIGVGIAGRHVWLQNLPPDEVPDCGPGLFMIMDNSPFFEGIATIFKGSGSCAEISWTFLGLSMPAWTLICYVVLIVFTILWMRIKVIKS